MARLPLVAPVVQGQSMGFAVNVVEISGAGSYQVAAFNDIGLINLDGIDQAGAPDHCLDPGNSPEPALFFLDVLIGRCFH